MTWLPLLSTIAGAVIAFAGSVVADQLRRRDTRHRYTYVERQAAYSEMVLALGAGLEALRQVANAEVSAQRRDTQARSAVGQAGVYVAREKILMTASPGVVGASEAVFDGLIGIRDAVREGARRRSPEFHVAYHRYAERMWALRLAIRKDLHAEKFTAADLNRTDWDGETSCDVCRAVQATAEPAVPSQTVPAGS